MDGFQDPMAVSVVHQGCFSGQKVGDGVDLFGLVGRVVIDHPFGRGLGVGKIPAVCHVAGGVICESVGEAVYADFRHGVGLIGIVAVKECVVGGRGGSGVVYTSAGEVADSVIGVVYFSPAMAVCGYEAIAFATAFASYGASRATAHRGAGCHS